MGSRKTKRSGHSLLGEYLYFLRMYKMWWLAPLFVLVAALGVFVMAAGSKAALMIYALF